METMDAITGRRSVRSFTDEPVTDDEIRQLLDAARRAPSWANTQSWEFIVVRDRILIEKLTDTYSPTNPARKCSASSSVVIVACARTRHAGFRDGVQRTRYDSWHMFDLGLAVQNLCLRAHDLGLGTVIVGSLNHEACDSVLGVPDGIETIVAIPVGRPAVMAKDGPARRELREFAHLNAFGSPFF